MKKPERLRNFLQVCSQQHVRNDMLLGAYAKGVIEGMVQCLMAQGATYERAWAIVKHHLPDKVSKQAIPKDWE